MRYLVTGSMPQQQQQQQQSRGSGGTIPAEYAAQIATTRSLHQHGYARYCVSAYDRGGCYLSSLNNDQHAAELFERGKIGPYPEHLKGGQGPPPGGSSDNEGGGVMLQHDVGAGLQRELR